MSADFRPLSVLEKPVGSFLRIVPKRSPSLSDKCSTNPSSHDLLQSRVDNSPSASTVWSRCWIGFRPSTSVTFQRHAQSRAEFSCGHRNHLSNNSVDRSRAAKWRRLETSPRHRCRDRSAGCTVHPGVSDHDFRLRLHRSADADPGTEGGHRQSQRAATPLSGR